MATKLPKTSDDSCISLAIDKGFVISITYPVTTTQKSTNRKKKMYKALKTLIDAFQVDSPTITAEATT